MNGPKGQKQPWYITAADGRPLSFAGLWERYRDPENGNEDVSATIIVGAANDAMRTIHSRMPAILDPADFGTWLGPDLAAAGELLQPAPEGRLRAHKVDRRVGKVQNDDPGLIAPIPT